MVSSLTKESFVPVSTHRLATPEIAWVNEERFSEQAAMENSYCIRQEYELPEEYGTDGRIQYADRYGGNGVGRGGGSGRCATFGNLQIKGVGRTTLVTQDADPYHTSGTMMLREAAREAIFSKVFESLLPYGVVHSLAIVLTGGMFSNEMSGTDRQHRRALLLREFTLRPAHYLRNILYKAETASAGSLSRDTERTLFAINSLDQAFEEVLGSAVAGTSGIDQINLGLRILAHRIAAQLAASFARRIFQTSLNCSNIALDGRFIDFGVTTFAKGYRKFAWAEKWLDQWSQHEAVQRTLHLLRFAVSKYWQGATGNLVAETDLMAEFQMSLQERMEIEMSKMTGAPEEIVILYPVESRQRLFCCLRNIYTREANETFIIWPATPETSTSNPAPEKMGYFDLNSILTFAATCKTDDELDQVLAAHLNDVVLRREFIHCYGDLRRFVLSHAGKHRKAAESYWTMQAIRINADLSFLKYELLDDQLMKFNDQPEGLRDYIDAKIDAGRYILQSDHPDIVGQGYSEQIQALSESDENWHNIVLKSASKVGTQDAIVNLLKVGFAS